MPMVKWLKKLLEIAIECFQTYCQNRLNDQFTSDDPLAPEIKTEGSANFYLTEGSTNSYDILANQNFKSIGEFPSGKSFISPALFDAMVESQKAQSERMDFLIKLNKCR